jgi:peptidoglycan/xylan/chitin deacetylase (PgdA/CDA1 family)
MSALQTLPSHVRDELVYVLAGSTDGPAQMLSGNQVRMLAEAGIAIGAHGYSHEPLTVVEPLNELTSARSRLERYACKTVSVLSFPHGRYERTTVAAAVSAGYRLMFTSDAALTPLSRTRRLRDRVLGRIDIPSSAITDASGRFSGARMATWLFPREARHLE